MNSALVERSIHDRLSTAAGHELAAGRSAGYRAGIIVDRQRQTAGFSPPSGWAPGEGHDPALAWPAGLTSAVPDSFVEPTLFRRPRTCNWPTGKSEPDCFADRAIDSERTGRPS